MRVALLLLLLGLAGCDGAAARFIDTARDTHAKADALARSGDPRSAARLLEDLVARPAPAGIAPQDRRVLLQDAYARLADLALKAGEPARARDFAAAGLALGEGHDVFSASLLALRGHAQEALGQDAEAARDYEAAQRIAEELLNQVLADGGSP